MMSLRLIIGIILAAGMFSEGAEIEEGAAYSYELKADEIFSVSIPFLDEKNSSSNFEVLYNGEVGIYSSMPITNGGTYDLAVQFKWLKVSLAYLPGSSSKENKTPLYEHVLKNVTEYFQISNGRLSESTKSSKGFSNFFNNLIVMLIPSLDDYYLAKGMCKTKKESGLTRHFICTGEQNLINKILAELSSHPILRQYGTQLKSIIGDSLWDNSFNFTRQFNAQKVISDISGRRVSRTKFCSLESTVSMRLLSYTEKSTFPYSSGNMDSISINSTMDEDSLIYDFAESLKSSKDKDIAISNILNALFINFGSDSSSIEDFWNFKQHLSQLDTFEYLNTRVLSGRGMNVFLSALAELGTDSSIQYLCGMIRDNKLDDLITLQFYRNLRNAKNIGEVALYSLASLVKLKTPGITLFGPKQPSFLTKQLFLGASHVAGSYCNRNVNSTDCKFIAARDTIVDYISENVNFDVHEENLKFALLALGNINQLTPIAVNAIESVLVDERATNPLKTIALTTIPQSGSLRLRKIAREILNDETNPEDIRVLAYLTLYETQTGFTKEDLQVINELFARNDTKISYFIGTHIHGIRNSALPSIRLGNQHLDEIYNLTAMNFGAKGEKIQAQRQSHFMEFSYYNEYLEMGVSFSITVAFSSGCRQPIYSIVKLVLEINGVRYDPIELRLNQRFFLNAETFYPESEPTDWLSILKSYTSKYTYIRVFNQTISCDLPSSSKFMKQKFFTMKTTRFGFTKSKFSLMNLISSSSLFDGSISSGTSFFGAPLVWELSSGSVVSAKSDAEGNPLTNGLGFLNSKETHLSGQANISNQLSFGLKGRILLGGNRILPVRVGREVMLNFDNVVEFGIDDFIFGKKDRKSLNVGINFSFPSEKIVETNFSADSKAIWSSDNNNWSNNNMLVNKSEGLIIEEACYEIGEICWVGKTLSVPGKMQESRKLEIQSPWKKGIFINVTLTKSEQFSLFGSFYNKNVKNNGEQSVEEYCFGNLEFSRVNKKRFDLTLKDKSSNENPVVSVQVFQDEAYSHVDGKFKGPFRSVYLNSSKTEAVRSFPAFSEWQCSDKISLNGNLSIELHRKVLGQYHNQTFLFTDLEGHTHIKQKTEETSTNKIKSWILLIRNGNMKSKYTISKKRIFCDENTIGVCKFWRNESMVNGEIRNYEAKMETLNVNEEEIHVKPNTDQIGFKNSLEHRITYREEYGGGWYFGGAEIVTPYVPKVMRLTMAYRDHFNLTKSSVLLPPESKNYGLSRETNVHGYYGDKRVALISINFPVMRNFLAVADIIGTFDNYATFNSSYNFTDHPLMLNLSFSTLSGDLQGSFKLIADKAILVEESTYTWRNSATGEYCNASNKLSFDFYKGRVDNKGTKSYQKGSKVIDPNSYNTHRNAGWGLFFLGLFGLIAIVLLILNASRRFMSSGRCRYSFNHGQWGGIQ